MIIGDDIIGTPLKVTPNGSIVGVTLPNDIGGYQFGVRPDIRINTNNGRGASLIPVLRYKSLSSKDPLGDKRSTLVGITTLLIVYDRRRSTKTYKR